MFYKSTFSILALLAVTFLQIEAFTPICRIPCNVVDCPIKRICQPCEVPKKTGLCGCCQSCVLPGVINPGGPIQPVPPPCCSPDPPLKRPPNCIEKCRTIFCPASTKPCLPGQGPFSGESPDNCICCPECVCPEADPQQ